MLRKVLKQLMSGNYSMDCLVLVMCLWSILCYCMNNIEHDRSFFWGMNVNDHIGFVVVFGVVYFGVRALSFIGYSNVEMLGCSYFALCLSRELFHCFYQLFHGHSVVVGTFSNPGILGGFIAVCISLLLAYVFEKWKPIFLLCLIPLAALVIVTGSRASWVSILVVLFVLSMRDSRAKEFIKKYYIIIICGILAVVVLLYFLKRGSADGRMFMAFLSLKNIKDVGLFGVGPGNYCGFYGRALYDYFLNDYCGQLDGSVYSLEGLINDKIGIGIPDCSYNEFIRIAVETGLTGLIICVALSASAFYRLYVNNDPMALGLLSLLVFAQFSYPYMYQVFYVMFAFFLGVGASVTCECKAIKSKHIQMAILSLAFLAFHIIRTAKVHELELKENLMCMNDYSNNGLYAEVIDIASKLYEREYCSTSFLLQYGESLSKTRNYEKSDSILVHGLEMSASPSFWRLLGLNSTSRDGFEKAEDQFIHSFVMAPNRILPLYDLAQLYNNNSETDKLSCVIGYSARFTPKIENEKTMSIRNAIINLNVHR